MAPSYNGVAVGQHRLHKKQAGLPRQPPRLGAVLPGGGFLGREVTVAKPRKTLSGRIAKLRERGAKPAGDRSTTVSDIVDLIGDLTLHELEQLQSLWRA
jgi:hypothetical protein